MAIETRVSLKDKLFDLLMIKKTYTVKGIEIVPFLEDAISRASASMEAEDVAYVEKEVEKRNCK